MGVAHPHQAVSLDAVPQVVLHVEVGGVGARHPDAVQARVARTERAQVGQVAIDEHRPHLLQFEGNVLVQQVEPREAEARIARLAHPVPGHFEDEIAHGVVVGGAALGGDVAHRLADRFAQPHPEAGRSFVRNIGRHDLQSAVYLAAEVQQDRGALAVLAAHHAVGIGGVDHLPLAFGQQHFGRLDQFAVLDPHHPGGRQVGPHTRVVFESVGHALREHRRQLGRQLQGTAQQKDSQ